jgi:hypothetical protein
MTLQDNNIQMVRNLHERFWSSKYPEADLSQLRVYADPEDPGRVHIVTPGGWVASLEAGYSTIQPLQPLTVYAAVAPFRLDDGDLP